MQYTTLGRTGFRVSRMGLGGGGHSRLGRSAGRTPDESIAVVRRALELGINFIDTAEAYETESIVGRGIAGHDRANLILSTKKAMWGDKPISAADLRAGLEQSLQRLATDYVDIYHLHGLNIKQYDHAIGVLVPEMLKLRDEGKIRALAVSEAFNSDRTHEMFARAMADDCWDVVMVGFNILNQSARRRVLAPAIENNVGTLCMFAVRLAFSQPNKLRQMLAELIEQGKLDRDAVDLDDPLGFAVGSEGGLTITDTAYRFCRDEPGMHVILCGTGNVAHLEKNVASIERPPLSPDLRRRLVEMFDGLDNMSGQ
jgi:aryl-alcohol dehydrogenase-like predicted oxidoreductase